MKNRLTKQDWIAHGFQVLKTQGHDGLKAERMVKFLKVSRGSFYWHFKSIAEFNDSLLYAWREETTEAVIEDLQNIPENHQQLSTLINRVIATPQDLEASMRAWAKTNAGVAAAVAKVDELRIAYLTKLITAQGVDETLARARAIVLSWAFIGRTFAPEQANMISERAVEDITAIFTLPLN